MVERKCPDCGNIHDCKIQLQRSHFYLGDNTKRALASYLMKGGGSKLSTIQPRNEESPKTVESTLERLPEPLPVKEPVNESKDEEIKLESDVITPTDLDRELQTEFNNKIVMNQLPPEPPVLFEDKLKQEQEDATSPKKKKKWTNYAKTKPWEQNDSEFK